MFLWQHYRENFIDNYYLHIFIHTHLLLLLLPIFPEMSLEVCGIDVVCVCVCVCVHVGECGLVSDVGVVNLLVERVCVDIA